MHSRDALKEGSTLEELVDRSPDDVLTVLKELAVAKFGTFTAKVRADACDMHFLNCLTLHRIPMC